MVNINAEPKPSYELTEEELDKATGGREGPRTPDQPDRDHQGCGQPIAQAVGARRTSDAAFFFLDHQRPQRQEIIAESVKTLADAIRIAEAHHAAHAKAAPQRSPTPPHMPRSPHRRNLRQ